MSKFSRFVNSLRTQDNKLLLESISKGYEAIYEQVNYPKGFDINELKNISGFAGKMRYVESHLNKIGAGSARVVYQIDDNTVLKLAKNKKGLAQNYVEGDWGLHDMYPDILPALIDSDEDDLWIIKKKADKITKKEFERLTGMKFDEFAATVHNALVERQEQKYAVSEDYEKIVDNEFFEQLVDMAHNFDMMPGDFERINTYGKIDEKPVVTDVGLTHSVFKEHYKR